jgi:hypothetical protein
MLACVGPAGKLEVWDPDPSLIESDIRSSDGTFSLSVSHNN